MRCASDRCECGNMIFSEEPSTTANIMQRRSISSWRAIRKYSYCSVLESWPRFPKHSAQLQHFGCCFLWWSLTCGEQLRMAALDVETAILCWCSREFTIWFFSQETMEILHRSPPRKYAITWQQRSKHQPRCRNFRLQQIVEPHRKDISAWFDLHAFKQRLHLYENSGKKRIFKSA